MVPKKLKNPETSVKKAKSSKESESLVDTNFVSSEKEAFASSSEDESENDNIQEEEDEEAVLHGFDLGNSESSVPPLSEDIKQQLVKRTSNQCDKDKNKKGIIYVGRIPHGFYEQQMKAYFSQFGNITRLRLSRNKKTGQSKHYAFIEFESLEVAKIVASTMDSYLLFGHILDVKLIASEEAHASLFKGANKRYKAVPWKSLSKHTHDKSKPAKQLAKLEQKFQKSNKARSEKLKKLGIEYLSGPVSSTKNKQRKKNANK